MAISGLTDREREMLQEFNEIHAILAEALGYPYDEEYGWATGEHTEVTLAMEARRKLKGLETL